MKSDCLVKRFLQTKGRRTNSLRFVTPSNQHHCFTFQNTIVFDSPIQMPTHPMIHSFIACRILENGVGMIHWDSLSFRWSFEMGCVWPSWILQHLDNSVVDSIDSMMISFLWSEWGVEWVQRMLWHCGSKGYHLLLNEHYSLKTEWNLSSQCVLLAWLLPLAMLNQSMNSFVKGNDLLILSSILTLLRYPECGRGIMRIYYPLISWSQFIRGHSCITFITSR